MPKLDLNVSVRRESSNTKTIRYMDITYKLARNWKTISAKLTIEQHFSTH